MTALELLKKSNRLREQADELEREAILLALQEANGFEGRAAKALGMWENSFKRKTRERWPDLAEVAAQLRANSGYRGGRPSDT